MNGDQDLNKLLDGYAMVSSYESMSSDFVGVKIFIKSPKHDFRKDDDGAFEISERAGAIVEFVRRRRVEMDPQTEKNKAELKSQFEMIFLKAGLQHIFMEEIPNQYWSYPPGDPRPMPHYAIERPWYIVTTRVGHVTIGWRKRVINIDWSKSLIKTGGDALFPNEDVTRGECYIHASSNDKAIEYLSVLGGLVKP